MPSKITNKSLEKRLINHKYPDKVILIRGDKSYEGFLYSECGEPAVGVNENRRTYYYFFKKGDKILLPVFIKNKSVAYRPFTYSSNGRVLGF